ncbi:acyl-CoA dehydratase activase [Mailhella massiliensis]|uniref:Acyl-CoA dehydratase activase n=1 Tax=Mailhella massiliensis TaxID=1903261 RepID=A0A921DRV2_9BACT|nr:acyl-CoA dehydratase activase [Mailhella massiliensis]HJD98060.1 acyl-CoA dehydratase activase [Mailhella massiliensis]
MFTVGVDIGSVAAKAVVYDTASRTVAGMALQPTGWNPKAAGEEVLQKACAAAGIREPDYIVATGYGRVSLPFAHKSTTEITCHAAGAVRLFPHTRVVLDIGGQDSKVIRTDADGSVQDFLMNDKCAAGTGRFLQVLSGILNQDLEGLNALAMQGTPAPISSMCAVFAETEIVGLLARGTPPADIAAGVLVSIARRMRALASRIPMAGECTFTGGLAVSAAFGNILSRELGVPINIPDHPQHTGAFGAAILAETWLNRARKRSEV